MGIGKWPTCITYLCAAALLGIALPVDTTYAHCKGKHSDETDCKHGGGGGSDTNVPLAVAVVQHNSAAAASSPLFEPDCEAQASSIKNLWAYFPRQNTCAKLFTDNTDGTGSIELPQIEDDIVIRVKIEKKKSGAPLTVISVQVIGQDVVGPEGLIYQSDVITDKTFFVESIGEGSFVIHVHADNVRLWKCDGHLLKGRTTCLVPAGNFAIHDMVYTPDP